MKIRVSATLRPIVGGAYIPKSSIPAKMYVRS